MPSLRKFESCIVHHKKNVGCSSSLFEKPTPTFILEPKKSRSPCDCGIFSIFKGLTFDFFCGKLYLSVRLTLA